MKRIARAIGLALLSGLLLPGCWDAKEIQYISYSTALGIDFDEKRQYYIAYVQVLDFSNVAKQAGAVPTEPGTVWVGRGEGSTMQKAMTDLYSTSQEPIFWGHTTSVIYHERLLREGRLQEAIDLTNRYRELRYTKWVYVTNGDLERILSVTPFFKQSPLESILHQPKEVYRQYSYVRPLMFQRFVALFHEPSVTVFIPVLDINPSQWKANEKNHPLLFAKGICAIYRRKWLSSFTEEEVPGLRWVQKETVREPIEVPIGGNRKISIVIYRPGSHITPRVTDGGPSFSVSVRADIAVDELPRDMSEREIISRAKEKIEDDIRQTYRRGIRAKTDLLELEDALYRIDPKAWKRYFSGGFPLRDDSLADVKVTLHLRDTGKYKLRYTE